MCSAELLKLCSRRTEQGNASATLIASYLETLKLINKMPIASMNGYLQFIKVYFTFIAGLIILPYTSFINLLHWVLSKINKQEPEYMENWFLDISRSAKQNLDQGEIPILVFFVSRNIVRLFTLIHIRQRMSSLLDQYNLDKVKAYIEDDAILGDVVSEQIKVIKSLESYIKGTSELKLILLLLPLLGIIPKIFSTVGITTFSFVFISYKQSTFFVLFILIYLSMVLASCFTKKRQIFRDANVYKAESQCFRLLHSTAPIEFPLDLTLWIVVFAIFAASYVVPYFQTPPKLFESLQVVVLMIAPLIYGMVRRVRKMQLD